MGIIELILVGIAALVLVQLRHVWFNYRVIGQLLDILEQQSVQDKLFFKPSNVELLQRTVNQYVFLTRYVPVLILGTFAVIGTIYMAVASGTGLSLTLSTVGALVLAGVVVWLITFEPVPTWLHDWHLTVLLTRSLIDLDTVSDTIAVFKQRTESGEYDMLTPIEREFVQLQLETMETVHKDVTAIVDDLHKQRAESQARTE